jgi:hypothetical protein
MQMFKKKARLLYDVQQYIKNHSVYVLDDQKVQQVALNVEKR